MTFEQEIARRRTFAIVAHPDAGKTTLTEKLLLFGGAIQVAGAVKSNKIKKTATSDFMEIERQRGISVTTSVMGFDYKGMKINILDTPGHEDFAEDTYRTLTAVDSVIVVVDAAKGVETQTEKLVRVCRMRDTPIIVFINKCDRPGQDPYDLLDEIEKKLGLTLRPLSWPIGMGDTFQGVYNLYEQKLNLFTESAKTTIGESVEVELSDDVLKQYIGERDCETLRNDVELITGVYPDFEIDTYRGGQVCPVFFGSALNNFGVRELLDCFINVAPSPQPAHTEERDVTPIEPKFSGFVFKIHANIDPNHRNRVAFLRITSGKFERNKPYTHVRLARELRFSNPTAFMADKREVIDEAFPGDIIGLHDTGVFRIGDSLTEGEKLHFTGIPAFSPEIFRYVENVNPLKSKQFAKGLEQLIDEGVVQMFISEFNGRRIVGTVGALQLEVLQYRLEHEYGATCRYETASLHKACWLQCDDDTVMEKFRQRKLQSLARDKHGTMIYLAQSAWDLNSTQELFPEVKFYFTSEMK